MPLPIAFTWSEDENTLNFVLQVRGVKAKNVDIALCDVYIKVNCHPSLFEADLKGEIDPEHPKTRCRVGSDKVTLTLRKREPGLWHEFRAEGSKEELRQRRQDALAAGEEREQARLKRREEDKQDKIKAGEHEQWRLDRENREQIEKWEQEEKKKWEEDMYATFDEDGKAAERPADALRSELRDGDDGESEDELQDDDTDLPDGGVPEPQEPARRSPAPPAAAEGTLDGLDGDTDDQQASTKSSEPVRNTTTIQLGKSKKANEAIWTKEDLDDTEEYTPPVREAPGKIGIRFTERPRAGVPVRDRGNARAPPHPKDKVKSELPPMIAGDDIEEDENDPVWLKDKGDKLMTDGDYQGANNAYTAALKLASNARCFANRAVAHLYLGDMEKCLEDCNASVRILDLRARAPEGQLGGSADPMDQVVRARVQVRMGTAYLWMGAFGKAEDHFTKALGAEEGLDFEMRQKVREDLERVKQAKASLVLKEKADSGANRARGGGASEKQALEAALALYGEAAEANEDSAVILANRCYAHLRAGQLKECLADGDAAIDALRRWPTARRAPKKPERPSRLDPPFIDDPTFKHPDEAKQGEVDWLMKHGGGSWKDLPSLPPEYEWVKDVAEKQEDAWIAIRKKMPKATIDAIRRATVELQDVLYTRRPVNIRQHIEVAIELNKAGEGPSNKAIRQSMEYADKLEEHEKEREAEREKEEEEQRKELEECNLEESLAPVGRGVAQKGFSHSHPVESSRRRLYVKVLLRRARAHELLGDLEAAAEELRVALRVEPANPEAKQRQATLEAARAAAEME